VYQAHIAFHDDREEVDEAFDVRAPGETGVEFAGAEGAVAGTVEDGLESVFVEKCPQAAVVFGVARNDAVAGEGPIIFLTNGDDLTGVAIAEVVEGVVTRDAGDAGDKEG
jgi:hypothetical protein